MFSLARWKRSAAVAPAPESVVAAARVRRRGEGKKGVMASNGTENLGDDGLEDMETDMSPEPNGEPYAPAHATQPHFDWSASQPVARFHYTQLWCALIGE